MAWPAPGLVRGRPAPRVPCSAIGAWGLVVFIPPGWAAGWRSGSTGCSRTTPMTTGGSPGRSPLAAAAGGRPVRPPPALMRSVGRSARAIPGPLPLWDPPPLGGATPSRDLRKPPWPRSAEAWRRSPAAHPGAVRPAPRRRPHPGAPVSDLATLRLTLRAALMQLPTGRRLGPMTPPSPCSAGNAHLPPRGPHRWRLIFRRLAPLPRAGPCPVPRGAARRLPHRSGSASPLQPAAHSCESALRPARPPGRRGLRADPISLRCRQQ